MFILANLISASAGIINIILTAYYWLILVRAIISWVNPDPFNPIVQFLYSATEPVLYPIRKIIPFSLKLGMDISPIIAFLIHSATPQNAGSLSVSTLSIPTIKYSKQTPMLASH